MTLTELFERAMAGHQPEVSCWALIHMFDVQGEDMPMGEFMELQRLVRVLDLDLESGDDAAHWSPDRQTTEGSWPHS